MCKLFCMYITLYCLHCDYDELAFAIYITLTVNIICNFELFADSRGLIMMPGDYTNRQQRRVQLLHFAGPDVQDTFLTLPNMATVRDYDAAVTALNAISFQK